MWPHKKGLGAQLSYGVQGNGILEVEETGGVKISYPRANQPQLGKLSIKSTCIVKSQINHSNKDTSARAKRTTKDIVPRKMLRLFQSASQTLNSVSAYDPTYGRTLALFYTRSSRAIHRRLRAVAYAAGKEGAHLAISLVVPLNKPDPVNPGIDSPAFLTPVLLDLTEPIKQIATFSGHKSLHDFLLVRTQSKVYVLNCQAKNDLKTSELRLVGEVTSSCLKNEPLVDVCWDSDDYRKFYMVDSKGNIARAQIDVSFEIKIDPIETQSDQLTTISEGFELSSWRRICKIGKKTFFVASRSSLIKHCMKPPSSERIITSETWSRIQDVHLLSQQDMLLLTSKEIIWVDIKENPTRILSWKHFWDDNDPSLKFEVTTIEDKHYCLLYSEASPLCISISFGYIDGRPCCLTSPSMIHLEGTKAPIHCLSLDKLDDMFYSQSKLKRKKPLKHSLVLALFDSRVNLEVNFNSLGIQVPIALNVDNSLDFRKLSKNIKATSVRPYSGVIFPNLNSKSLQPLVVDIKATKENSENEVELVQEFAFRLGEGADKLRGQIESRKRLEKSPDASYLSILDISDTIPSHVSKVDEFDTMFDQLKSFYKDNGIDLKVTLDHFLKSTEILKLSPLDSIKGVADYLESLPIENDNSNFSLKKVALLLFSSFIKSRPNDLLQYYDRKMKEELEMVSTNTKAIIGSWNSSEDISTLVDDFSTNADNYEPITSSLPIIKIASQDMSTLKQSSKRPRNTMLRESVLRGSQNTQTDTLATPPGSKSQQISHFSLSRPSSQLRMSQSSQKSKKKKKRGFA